MASFLKRPSAPDDQVHLHHYPGRAKVENHPKAIVAHRSNPPLDRSEQSWVPSRTYPIAGRAELPSVSIIVPTYNRRASLAVCLRALASLAYPRDRYEVIVVDDGSTEALDPVIDLNRHQLDIKLVQCSHAGVSKARNVGLARARGELVAFTDDDCVAEREWIAVLVRTWLCHPTAMIGGRTRNLLHTNRYSEMAQQIVDVAYTYYNADSTHARFFASNNLAAPRENLIDMGGFDECFQVHASEDRELCDRWSHAGRPLVYADEAIVGHAHPLDLSSFVGLCLRHGRGAYHHYRLCRRRGSGYRGDIVRFRRHIGVYTSNRLDGRDWATRLRTWALFSLWETANLAGYCYEAVTRRGYAADRKGAL